MSNADVGQKVVDLLGQLQSATPAITDLAIQTERWSAIGHFVIGLFGFMLFVGSLWGIFRLARADNVDDKEGLFLIVGFLTFLGLVVMLPTWLDVWTWIGMSNPKLALVHDLLDKIR